MKAKAEFLIFLIIKDRMNFLVTCNGYHPMRNMYLEKAVGKIKRWKVTVEVGKQLCFRFYFSNHNLSS